MCLPYKNNQKTVNNTDYKTAKGVRNGSKGPYKNGSK